MEREVSMNRMYRKLSIFMVVLSVVALAGVSAFAISTSLQRPSGEPPYGVAVQSDAQGIKVTGVIVIHAMNINPVDPGKVTLADLNVVLRLRKGKDIKVIYTTTNGCDIYDGCRFMSQVNIDDAEETQNVISQIIRKPVLAEFFNYDQSLTLKLKALEEFVGVDVPLILPAEGYIVADIVIAVK